MATKIKPAGKIAIIALFVGGLYAAYYFWFSKLPKDSELKTTVVGTLALPDEPNSSFKAQSTKYNLPSTEPTANGGSKIVWKVMAWNSQFPLMYANGGPMTTKGSLIDNAKLQVEIVRQDDCFKSIADIVKFAQDYKNDPQTPGVFASFMGDGMPVFFASLAKELEPLGPEYQPVAFYAMGKSYGEDQLMGPASWKVDPKNAIGRTVCCVLKDGDMNIMLKWAGDNGLKVNPDEKTYDKDAINLIAAPDFLAAANNYITGYKEKRKIVKDGKITAEEIEVGVDAVATWTPGDVNIAQKKGGLVTIASTKQYSTQMPNITITIKKYLNDHRMDIENLIVALAQAGDQVRSFSDAKKFAADVSAKVYNEQNGAYWMKYYDGIVEKDMQGNEVNLGGSMAFNLADAANTFGLGDDKLDRYKAVYVTFGDIIKKLYPIDNPTYPEYSTVVDKSFIATVIANHPELLTGEAIAVNYKKEDIKDVVSSKSYEIQFATGSAEILPESYAVLEEIKNSAVVAENLKLGVYGHTDNTGNADKNQLLSEERAASVKKYLVGKGLAVNRIESKGFGQTQPIADNTSAAGKAKNRRVQIVLGQ